MAHLSYTHGRLMAPSTQLDRGVLDGYKAMMGFYWSKILWQKIQTRLFQAEQPQDFKDGWYQHGLGENNTFRLQHGEASEPEQDMKPELDLEVEQEIKEEADKEVMQALKQEVDPELKRKSKQELEKPEYEITQGIKHEAVDDVDGVSEPKHKSRAERIPETSQQALHRGDQQQSSDREAAASTSTAAKTADGIDWCRLFLEFLDRAKALNNVD